MVYALTSFPTALDPALNYVKSYTQGPAMGAVYGFLAYADPSTGETVNSFLTSVTGSKGNTVWTLVLHKGLKFSDGTPFNAAAIAFNIHRGADPSLGDTFQADLAAMTTKVINATTLRITLPTPTAGFPAQMSQEFPFIASPTALTAEGQSYGLNPVGAGPFKVSQWVQNSTLTLVRNPRYSAFAPGQPYLSQVVFQNLPASQTQVIAAIASGTAQMTWIQGNTQISQARAAGAVVTSHQNGGGQWLDFNMSVAPFNNPIARQAVYDALDHQSLAAAWTPGIPAMTNLFSKKSVLFDAKYNFPPPNTTEAMTLFTQLNNAGTPVHFTCTAPSPYNSICGYVQSTLSQYPGVQVGTSILSATPYLQAQPSGNFQMIVAGTSYVNPNPILLQTVAGPQNYSKWNNSAVNAAAAVLQGTTSLSVEKKQWGIIEQQYLKDLPFFTAQESLIGLAYSPHLGGVHGVEFGNLPLVGQIYQK